MTNTMETFIWTDLNKFYSNPANVAAFEKWRMERHAKADSGLARNGDEREGDLTERHLPGGIVTCHLTDREHRRGT